jgi:uncharacterized protein (TIGR02217 family)
MAFHDVQLPVTIERGAQGGPTFRTGIVETISGYEQRNGEWGQARMEWDISYGIQSKTDYSAAIQFFYSRKGKLHGFRFKDWTDFEATAEATVPSVGDTVETDFQLTKTYTDAGGLYARTILLPVTSPNTVTVYLNGSPQTIITHYTIESGGIIRFVTPPTGAESVTADFEFDVPVRFDEDKLELAVDWYDGAAVPALVVRELREIT